MIAIIDCCGSNFASIKYAFEKLGQQIVLTHDAEVIKKSACVILPGVGHAKSAMDSLRKNNLDKLIPELTQPVLGICLGMQIMYSFSEEGSTACLGIFPEKVKAFKKTQGFSIPHMGWNSLQNVNKDHFLFKDIAGDDYVYFVHSFYAELNQFSITTNDYINDFTAMVNKDNFYGIQFHPEKSGRVGMKILENFIQGAL
ncbi:MULTISPECIES: imidazole glycerol phosphate synthase subunit HisH [unclassified Francisella]|uniref:imidazole glycerol phosphate synthase subunit HisH n=1 Tax=unclassified Francisella TaxID=2610885 RepID=UPI002E37EC17|nr:MULTISPECIES: imidazole glycerol phosphate synthase subunit HisH [unclassified Francisella]MED7819307.1 imidazole glycerol phosphate synthase subunit HisH [Francisella sp. 19S2-4]MED7830063.1 imidazole glycerol phosphate synthase subunit HisH [Francisella sp. 19S2-10]